MSPDTTILLKDLSKGVAGCYDQLMPRIYDELKKLADIHLYKERDSHTLNATALVHEAYFKLIDQNKVNWQNRAHFLAVASTAMRRILLNYAESRRAEKRGGGQQAVTLFEDMIAADMKWDEIITLDELLNKLAENNERACKIVEAKFYGGLSQEEIAEVMDLSVKTISRDWRYARAWLRKEFKQAS